MKPHTIPRIHPNYRSSPCVRMCVWAAVGGSVLWAVIITAAFWWSRIAADGDSTKRPRARPRLVLDDTTTYSTVSSPDTVVPEFLGVTIHGMPEETWSVGKIAAFLRAKGCRVCSEELPRARHQRPTVFPLSSHPRTLREILDDVVACDPNYRWDFVISSEIVNIVPNRSRLNVPLQLPSDEGRRLIHCIGELYGPCKLHGSDFLLGNFKDPGRIENWPFNVRGANVLARDYLNQLAEQYDGMSWYVTSGSSVYFEVHPQNEFDRVAERLRNEVRQRDEYLRHAVEAEASTEGNRSDRTGDAGIQR